MTREEAKSELMQIYGILSEKKKQALDVLMAQADGEYIGIKDIHSVLHNHMFDNAHRPTIYAELKRISKELDGLTVAIPPDHDGCKDCRWQSQSETEMPCKQCMHNYTDEWEREKPTDTITMTREEFSKKLMEHYSQGRADEKAYQNGEIMQSFNPD